jgi:hypothetical protein
MRWGKATVIGLLLLFGIWVIWHPISAEAQKGNPPLSCQILGGEWNIWSGWHCNTISSDLNTPIPTPAPAPNTDTNTRPPDTDTPPAPPVITGNTSSPYPNQTDNNGLPCGSSVGDCTEP